MKKLILFCCSFFLLCSSLVVNAQGSFRVRSDEFVQVGYDQYNVLSFGESSNGDWAVEHWNNGLNFSKPYPSTAYGNYKLFIKDNNGYVGIGRVPSYKLDVEGDIATYGTLRISSDERLKTNVVLFNNTSSILSQVLNLNTYYYNYYKNYPIQNTPSEEEINISKIKELTTNGDVNIDSIEVDDKLRYGFLAQEVRNVFPELVDEDENGMLNVDYLTFIPILIEAVKEQQTYINSLEERIEALERR